MSDTVNIKIRNARGEDAGSHSGSAVVFSSSVKGNLLHQVVRWQRAKKRAGTHSVLTRAEMSGGGAKPWKQKGTGRARAGSNTSPLWVGGGIAHGPKPRKYDFNINKKELKQALRGAVSARREEERLFLLESFDVPTGKTKDAAAILRNLGIQERESTLVVLPAGSTEAVKSLRNIENVKVIEPSGLNVYDILASKNLVLTTESCKQVEARLGE